MSFMTPMGMFCGGAAVPGFSVANLFAISLAPANTMAATLAALPFTPDVIIDKDRSAASPWSFRSAGIGSGKTVTSDSTNGTAIPTTWAGYSGTDNLVAYGIKKHPRFFNEVVFTTDAAGSATFSHGMDPSVSIGLAEFKSTNVVAPWRVYAIGAGGSKYFTFSFSAPATSTNWFTATTTQVSVTGLAASATYVAHLYAHDTASDGIVQSGVYTSGNISVNIGWKPQLWAEKEVNNGDNWYLFDAARGFTGAASAPSALMLDATGTGFSPSAGAIYPTATGIQETTSWSNALPSIYLAIRAVGG